MPIQRFARKQKEHLIITKQKVTLILVCFVLLLLCYPTYIFARCIYIGYNDAGNMARPK